MIMDVSLALDPVGTTVIKELVLSSCDIVAFKCNLLCTTY